MTDYAAAAAHASKIAKQMRPLAFALLAIGAVFTLRDVSHDFSLMCVDEMAASGERFSLRCSIHQIGLQLIHIGPALALLWALWEAQTYLARLEKGDLFVPDTMALFSRIGEALVIAAAWKALFAPTLLRWVSEQQGGIVWDLDADSITLAGLGVILSAIGRAWRAALEASAEIKSENDAIV